MTTCDPNDINNTIKHLAHEKIRVSVIGLAAETQVCKNIANKTHGVYNVIMNEGHFKDLLADQIPPPFAETERVSSDLVLMGFPLPVISEEPFLCAWYVYCHSCG